MSPVRAGALSLFFSGGSLCAHHVILVLIASFACLLSFSFFLLSVYDLFLAHSENWMSAALERMMKAVKDGDRAGTAKAARALLDGITELERDIDGRPELEAAVARLKKLLQQLALSAKNALTTGAGGGYSFFFFLPPFYLTN